ncbi:MAG: hypothetical protein CML22_07180 [Rheinheimera sp.]|nr:hypothetical protein [Rheinheimera sp.]MBM34066.1 hypothetical protein [Rheinheimera sp.]|tara:strand:+ start:144 stop:605 length:462 start_codon:yes stop_codon:yes gene_type:complete
MQPAGRLLNTLFAWASFWGLFLMLASDEVKYFVNGNSFKIYLAAFSFGLLLAVLAVKPVFKAWRDAVVACCAFFGQLFKDGTTNVAIPYKRSDLDASLLNFIFYILMLIAVPIISLEYLVKDMDNQNWKAGVDKQLKDLRREVRELSVVSSGK